MPNDRWAVVLVAALAGFVVAAALVLVATAGL
jgi:hypothetical protein